MATTPWGELRVSDAHVHFFSHSFYSKLAAQKHVENAEALAPLLEWEIPPADSALAHRWARELDAHGVARACLIGSLPGEETAISHAVAAHPDRFFGYFMLDPLSEGAVERMERAAADPHLHCVCLFPAMHQYSIADERVRPVLDIAQAKHKAVFVHCGALSVGVRKKLGLPSPFDMRMSRPLDLHPVAMRYPAVVFIVPHFGAGFLQETLMLADLCPNVFLDTSSTNHWMKYDGLDLRSVFGRSIDVIGLPRLLFGSDSSYFPRGWNAKILEAQSKALYELGLKDTEAQMILSGNLERLMGSTKQ